jgi:D-alanyl-D-alanine carboxypeptidase
VNLRIVVLGLIAVFGAVTITTSEADARRYKSGKGIHARSKSKNVRARVATARYSPPYAAIVVDANSGAVLHENSADSRRHPASLTKIMTLYMLFERLEVGKIKLDTEMDVTARAASQSPSRLGLKAGSSIRVEDAIRALVTKSANDAAVVVAEALGGDEPQFARMMTRKACPILNRSPPRAIKPCSDAPSRTGSRNTTATSRPTRSPIAAMRCAITTGCWVASKASTASKPAMSPPPVLTW